MNNPSTPPKPEPIINKKWAGLFLIIGILCLMFAMLIPKGLPATPETPAPPNISFDVDYDAAEILYTQVNLNDYVIQTNYTTLESIHELTEGSDRVWWIAPCGGHIELCYAMGTEEPEVINASIMVYNATASTAQIKFGVEVDKEPQFTKYGGLMVFPKSMELQPDKYEMASFTLQLPLSAYEVFNFKLYFTESDIEHAVFLEGANVLSPAPLEESSAPVF